MNPPMLRRRFLQCVSVLPLAVWPRLRPDPLARPIAPARGHMVEHRGWIVDADDRARLEARVTVGHYNSATTS